MYRSLGQWSFRNWKLVVLAWVLAIVGVIGASGAIGSAFDSAFEIPESESRDGFDALGTHFAGLGDGQPGSIVFRTDLEEGVNDPRVVAVMTELFEFTRELDEGLLVVSPYEEGPQPQIALEGPQAGKIAYADVTISIDIDQVEAGEYGGAILDEAQSLLDEAGLADDVQVEVGGDMLGGFEPPETELIGLAFAVIVLILAFGSVLAMGLPIGVAVAGVGIGIGIINLLTNVILIPDIATQIGAMIGLGVGIDYALFIVTRYRTTRAAGYEPIDAVGIAMDTAGRSVVFAGITVVMSLLGMLLMGLAFISGLGIGAASTVTITMIASITLLPAMLGLVGDRLEITKIRGLIVAGLASVALFTTGIGLISVAAPAALAGLAILLLWGILPLARVRLPGYRLLNREIPPRKTKPMQETIPYRWSRLIQAHPWLALAFGVTALLVLASPLLGLRLGFSDEGNFPEDTTTRRAYDLIAEGFGPGFNGPLLITVVPEDPAAAAGVEALFGAVATTPGVASAALIPNNFEDPSASDAFLIRAIPTTSPQDEVTDELVETLRDDIIPTVDEGLEVSVTGAVPANIDFTQYLSTRILLFFGVVLAVSFVLLMAVFRSLVVPLKAVLMNVLSIAAAYGMVVAIFQWGWLGELFGIAGAPIEPFVPMMLFAIVFGLSMDYEVFLLSRIKEEYHRTGDTRRSVADGLAGTARVISAAAAIMIVVFGSFMFDDNRIVKLFGLGLAMAVFLDASFVRMLLVPATMELLGDKNWWLPRWLDRIIPNLNIEGTEPPPLDGGDGPDHDDSGLDDTGLDEHEPVLT
jgi:RND superfamily putative drug exporter